MLPFDRGWNPWQCGGLMWQNTEQTVDNTISCWEGSVNFMNLEHPDYAEAIKRDIQKLVRVVRKEARVAHIKYDIREDKTKVWLSPGAQEFFDSGGQPSACHGPGPFRKDMCGRGRLIDYPGQPEMFQGTPYEDPNSSNK